MVFRLFNEWIAVAVATDDASGLATVLAVGESVDEVGPGDLVLVDPDAGVRLVINGRTHRLVARDDLIGVVDAPDDVDDDMRPRYPADDDDDDDEGEPANA